MSLPRATYDPRRVFVFRLPSIPGLAHKKREIGIYSAGALFAIGWAVFFDALILSKRARPPVDGSYDVVPVHMTFVDWIPGILGTLGMLITNLIDKSRLSGDGGAWGGEGSTAFRARLALFIGFALMAGGVSFSITLLIVKYILPDYPSEYHYYGISTVVQNVGIMLSSVVLWLAQMAGDGEYEYNINL
ncbi:Predicted membrane protein [Phaffia rhodozyma]|uniref:Predicted membrane protein n=1 Tax=Phaffia rhodozyma TaxID=264483 RepID=A0A0F7SEA2_PHARH|nr:Predicted membrane protein [Phaffia rhodozyma]